jgi:ABC-type nickel/cobalt efflux system permease component RcnA
MGNFSISHYAGIHVQSKTVEVEYIIDMAEIPTFQEMQQTDVHTQAYLTAKSAALAQNLTLTLDGHSVTLKPVSQSAIFPVGAGNLPTMKIGFVYRAALPESCRTTCDLEYNDANFEGRTGWKEIVIAAAKEVHLETNAFATDRSSRLTNYPTDLVNSPPQNTEAKIHFTIVRPVVQQPTPQITAAPQPAPVDLKPNKQSSPRNAFTELVAHKEITFSFAFLAALIAAGLGALHAMEPGHGKTIVAAYLVGSKGTARHALLLGLIVTISHTAGVYLLGAVTLYAQQYIMPDRLYPFLSVLSGVLIAGMGIYILLKRLAGDAFIDDHGPNGHSHGFLSDGAAKLSKRQFVILGVTGGMVPCPAALVVLLSAVALHRVGFGLFLIVAFSLGLAAVLIGMGLAAVYAGRLLNKVPVEGKFVRLWMPAASAAMITIFGCVIAVQGLMTAGILHT